MKKQAKKCLPLFLALLLLAGVALAAGRVNFSFSNLRLGWRSSSPTQSVGNTWRVRIDSAENHGVGAVFLTDKWTRASGIFTYNANTTGWREPKSYRSNVTEGTEIVWRMRQDDDYTSPFACSGAFEP